MALLIGVCLALVVALFAYFVGLDRDRAFYATVLAVVASYCGLFAVMSGSRQTLLLELIVVAAFLVVTALGFKRSQWLLVVGLVAHGVFDYIHSHVISNGGVPSWWPDFCLSYDLTAATCRTWLIWRRSKAKDAV